MKQNNAVMTLLALTLTLPAFAGDYESEDNSVDNHSAPKASHSFCPKVADIDPEKMKEDEVAGTYPVHETNANARFEVKKSLEIFSSSVGLIYSKKAQICKARKKSVQDLMQAANEDYSFSQADAVKQADKKLAEAESLMQSYADEIERFRREDFSDQKVEEGRGTSNKLILTLRHSPRVTPEISRLCDRAELEIKKGWSKKIRPDQNNADGVKIGRIPKVLNEFDMEAKNLREGLQVLRSKRAILKSHSLAEDYAQGY